MFTGFCKEVNLEDSLLDGQSKLITEPRTSNALKDILRKRNSVYILIYMDIGMETEKKCMLLEF